jgi:PAS domain S-box-containing protein
MNLEREVSQLEGSEKVPGKPEQVHTGMIVNMLFLIRVLMKIAERLCLLPNITVTRWSCWQTNFSGHRSNMVGLWMVAWFLVPLFITGWLSAEASGQTADLHARYLPLDRGLQVPRFIAPPAPITLAFDGKDEGSPVQATNQDQETNTTQYPIIRIGVLANRGKEICLSEWAGTAEFLSRQLMPRRFQIIPLDFSEVRTAAEQRRVEFLLVNSSMYVTLEYHGLVYRIATFQQPSIQGGGPLPLFGGVIFCRADRKDIQSLRDMVGKRFAAVEPSSFGGWQAAWREFKQLGIEPERDFAQLVFSGTHDAVVEAVGKGQVDGGTVRSTQLERMALEGGIDLSEFRALMGPPNSFSDYPFLLSTRLYPEWPFAAVMGTDLDLGKSVASALLRMDNNDPAAKASRGAGWAIPQDYTSLHECLRELRIAPYEHYGEVTFRQALAQYWGFILAITAVTAALMVLSFLTWRTSARLKISFLALKQSELKFRGVVENIEDVFYRVDAQGRIAIISPSAARLLGYDSANDLIGQSPDIFWADPSQRLAMIHELTRFGHVREWEFKAIGRDGSLLTAAATLHVIRDEQGNPLGYEGIWRNIGERKQAEEKLRDSEESFRRLFEDSTDAILLLDDRGFIDCNPATLKLFGYSKEEILSTNAWDLSPPKQPDGSASSEKAKKVIALAREHGHHHFEWVHRRADGSDFPVAVMLTPVILHGKPLLHASLRDITERKKTEEALQRSTTDLVEINRQLESAIERANQMAVEAETANVAKSEFLANMSHEIRTPMNGVIGIAGLLMDTKLTTEQRRYAEIIRSSGETLLSLINDILDFSKIEAGKLELEILDFDLRTTLEDTIEMLAARAAEKKLELVCLMDPEVPSHLRGDPGRVRQVIVNLVGNAIKFTAEGEVVIRTSLVREDESTVTVRFAVTDTGIGVPSGRVDALFSPFTQVDGSTTRKYGGTGLGLAICKQLAELMGGRIAVESNVGKGSTFWFTAVLEKPADDRFVAPTALADLRGVRVLVVDDNATNRLLITELLKSWGCRFEEEAEPGNALDKLKEAAHSGDPFQVALLDMLMPGMDGMELGRRIKASPKLAQTRLILVTSLGQRGDATRLKEIGFSGYLPKPVRQNQLRDSLMLVMGQQLSPGGSSESAIVTRHTVAEAAKNRMRILLAEDNVSNQQVAQAILKKLGYHADVVGNGREALKALEDIPYDLVLMDCQMPEMDGYNATTVIRDPRSQVQNHKVPVIALTANAMQGDREKCLEAGMDDYLAKPLRPPDLADVLDRWLGKESQEENLVPPQKQPPPLTTDMGEADHEIFNEADLVERLMGDKDLAWRIAAGFLDDMEKRFTMLRASIESEDHASVRLHAHTIKGAAANVAAPLLRESASQLEQAGMAGDLETIRRIHPELELRFAQLSKVLNRGMNAQ